MKKFTLICLALLMLSRIKADIITVYVTNNQFTPANFTCTVGDTIRYSCSEGFHNITSTTVGPRTGLIPLGAPQIYSGLPVNTNLSNAWTYDYVVLAAGNYRYYCQVYSPDGINGMVGYFTANPPLPAELKNFDARLENNTVAVSWQTLTEQNVNYFAVRRSFNGVEFSELARVKATGNSTALQSYRFTDNNPGNASSFIYYSLVTVDQDGKQSQSPIVMVKMTGAVKKLITSLSPNPISQAGQLMVQFNADGSGKLYAAIYSVAGKKVAADMLNSEDGMNSRHLRVGNLPPGIYNIVFTLGKQQETHRIVIK